jgi:hypothetical protein
VVRDVRIHEEPRQLQEASVKVGSVQTIQSKNFPNTPVPRVEKMEYF